MAVYTQLSKADIAAFIKPYGLGALVSASGISEGVSNTNYLLTIDKTRYILTVFEPRTESKDVPFFMALTEWLSARGIPCPRPLANVSGKVVHMLKGKPAVLVEFLPGRNNPTVTAYHVRQLGALAAHMHLAGADFPKKRPNGLGLKQWKALFADIEKHCDRIIPGLSELIGDELNYLDKQWPKHLPSGVIHADLFPDNVFFKGDSLSGVIDFYYACNDYWMYDLMITLNAWCFNGVHQFLPGRAKTLLQSYHVVRPIAPAERSAMQVLARGAALRILLTRSHAWLNRAEGALVTPHDPLEYAAKLIFHQQNKL